MQSQVLWVDWLIGLFVGWLDPSGRITLSHTRYDIPILASWFIFSDCLFFTSLFHYIPNGILIFSILIRPLLVLFSHGCGLDTFKRGKGGSNAPFTHEEDGTISICLPTLSIPFYFS